MGENGILQQQPAQVGKLGTHSPLSLSPVGEVAAVDFSATLTSLGKGQHWQYSSYFLHCPQTLLFFFNGVLESLLGILHFYKGSHLWVSAYVCTLWVFPNWGQEELELVHKLLLVP